jgi:hypothetical protein
MIRKVKHLKSQGCQQLGNWSALVDDFRTFSGFTTLFEGASISL